jgi:hypothetical protein
VWHRFTDLSQKRSASMLFRKEFGFMELLKILLAEQGAFIRYRGKKSVRIDYSKNVQRWLLAVSWQGNELKIYTQRETPIGAFN